jgi:excisionase family DNA binding protein
LLDADEAATLLKVPPSWVRDASRQGRLPCIRVGRHVRYTRSMLEVWVAEQHNGSRRLGAHPREGRA